jgi:16S rRNA (guanine527-N7)-methyltransferase
MDDAARRRFLAALIDSASDVGVPLDPAQAAQCLGYAELLLTANARTNLTRITEPEAIAVKHFSDSLTVLRAVPDLAEGTSVVDVGTGAGFPGVVLKIARPDLRVTLLDSLAKRLSFLSAVTDALGLADVTLVHSRAEDAARERSYRDRFDLATARAVASLPTLLEWCGPLVRVGGRFVAMKSGGVDAELAEARSAANALCLRQTRDVELRLPSLASDEEPALRRLLVYEKLRPTPPRYPRRPAEIKAQPL